MKHPRPSGGRSVPDGNVELAEVTLLSLPLVGSRRAKLALRVAYRERSERCDGRCLSKRDVRALPCATPTRRFAPPSPQGGGIRAYAASTFSTPRRIWSSSIDSNNAL